MKRKVTLAIIIFLIVGITLILVTNKDTKIEKDEEGKNNSSFISMMIEDENGEYVEAEDTNFPIENYIFNPKKSNCKNGSKIKYEDNAIVVQATTSDLCYAYFDRDELGSICRDQNMGECFVKNYKKDETLIYHDGSIKDKEGNVTDAFDYSYRYAGASEEVNNFVCLDGGEYTTGACVNEDTDLYRIIGLFKNDEENYEIKLIKNESIGEKEWNKTEETVNGHYANEWKYSTLNIELNGTYYDSLNDSLKKMIVNHKWYHSGCNEWTTAKITREYEMGLKSYAQTYPINTEITTDYIGLMYASDYGFAVDSQYYNVDFGTTNSADASKYNWLSFWSSSNWVDEWTIIRNSDFNNRVWFLSKGGSLNGSNNYNIVTELRAVRPCFYLSSDVKIQSGEGSKEKPYRLSFE